MHQAMAKPKARAPGLLFRSTTSVSRCSRLLILFTPVNGRPAGSRYIYDLYYGKEAISRELYDFLLKHKYGDADLIAKWKKQGYEKLCCLKCDFAEEKNFKTKCICRVPKKSLQEKHEIECVTCGCRGCASGD